MRALRTLVYLLSALIAVTVVVLLWRSDVEPQSWVPAPLPAMSGKYSPANASDFSAGETIPMPAHGPEDVARDAAGRFYTGLSNGDIIRFNGAPGEPVEVIANTGGRPLGLQFDAQSQLIIADAVKGLLALSPDGKITVLTSEVNGVRMRLVDDLDIASDGTIWFSDASQRYGIDSFMKDLLEASFTGRLLSYSPTTGRTTVHMDGLSFANGVALGPGEMYVLVTETGTGRIHRLWLKTARKGQQDLFHDGLPGHPDNLSFNGSDTFWVAMPDVRNPARERTSEALFVRRLLGGLPASKLNLPSSTGFVIGLDVEGNVTHMIYEDPAAFSSITSVNQYGQQLLLGSLTSTKVLSVTVPSRLE